MNVEFERIFFIQLYAYTLKENSRRAPGPLVEKCILKLKTHEVFTQNDIQIVHQEIYIFLSETYGWFNFNYIMMWPIPTH